MHSNICILIWRRKLSVLLLLSGLVLVALWTWAFFDTTTTINSNSSAGDSIIHEPADNYKHVYIIQKLISQANRILRAEQEHREQKHHQPTSAAAAGQLLAAAEPVEAHATVGKHSTSIVRFLKPTKSPPTAILEASAQTISLVARRKKTPALIVGESYLFEAERLKILENQQRIRNAGMDELNPNNIMDYERMLSSAERQTQYEHELQRMGVPVIAGIGPDGPRAPAERLVHLDLKGAPPKLTFLKQLLPMLKTLGATGLLIEYEDMFPYTGALHVLSAKNAYKEDELKDFLETAALHGLSIMPLVQAFGHMEYALKLNGFEHMRELHESPQSICPSQQDSIAFIEHMITQIVEFHLRLGNSSANGDAAVPPPDAPINFTHLHIGCDEVYRMAECERCRQRQRNELFLTHVTTIANFVRNRWPQLRVVIWDDMLRDMTLSEMQHSQIGKYVEPMIWVYSNDIYHFIQPQLWDMYAKVFPTAWGASAFKGAFGESLMVVPLQRHLENNIRWLAVIAKEGSRFSKGFKGLALTGWQRYDHFAVLCELLPVGIPSLITALSTVSKGYFSANPKDNDILRVLQCIFQPDSRRSGHPWIELQSNSHHSQLFSTCNYPGHMVFKFALRLYEKLYETQNYLQHVQEKSAWMSDYNVRHNFSSPLRVRDLTVHTPTLINELVAMSREAQQLMYDIYDEHTIAEFVEQNIYPTIAALRRQLANAENLLQRRTWPQRPLPYRRELVEANMLQLSHNAGGEDIVPMDN